MSYILDALQKAERERALGRVPDLAAGHGPASREQRRLWPWLVGLGLLANAAVVAALWLLPQSPPSAPPAPARTLATAPLPEPSPPAALPVAPASSRPAPVAALAPPPVVLAPEPPPAPTPPIPRRAPPGAAATTAAEPPPPAAAQPPSAAAQPSKLALLPESLRDALPPLNVDAHVYAEEPARRFVLINLRRYREGERLNEGPRLEAITREGVVLNFREQSFLLPVHP